MKSSLFTVITFAKINAKRFFRDKLAIFFSIAFPLIFLVIFGSLFGGNNTVSFTVAVFNESNTDLGAQIEKSIAGSEVIKPAQDIANQDDALEKLSRSSIDAIVIIPESFGQIEDNKPGGEVTVRYSQNDSQVGQTLGSIMQTQLDAINVQIVGSEPPLSVNLETTNQESLTPFDYTFAGLMGFAIIGLGIFGPVSVFPELKKQKVLRRLHTTPLKVWQYFVANVMSQGFIGVIAIAVLLAFAMAVFDLRVQGSILDFFIFVLISIIAIYGIGLAIGGWAKTERQAAPLSNLIVFPMIFLSGTFFPRFIMPEWLQTVSDYLPLTPVIDGMRLIVAEGASLSDISAQLGLIAIWILIIYAIAFKVFRWE
jgi:ABC-2 type transport system permease protein